MGALKTREWTTRHEMTRVDKAGGKHGQTLPTTSAEADTAVRNSRYAVLDDSEFYRGLADAGGDGSALVFASNAQLELLQSATQIYFDATFNVLPTIYYQLFTVVLFVPFADSAFPVFYAVMSRKTNALYTKAFEKVKELVFSRFILGTTFSTPAFSTPGLSTPALSTPGFSTPVISCHVVNSRVFHPCNFDRAELSTPAISVAPFRSRILLVRIYLIGYVRIKV